MPMTGFRSRTIRVSLLLIALAGCANPRTEPAGGTSEAPVPGRSSRLDATRLLGHVQTLAADSFRGRRTESPGGLMARAYIRTELQGAGLRPVGGSFDHPFTFPRRDSTLVHGANVVGMVPGTRHPGRFIVVTGHYDHVGIGTPVNGDSIYNGADDNASGTASVIELARYFAAHPPENSMLFVAFDAEEMGLRGARAFVADPPVPRDSIIVNVNMDMVSRSPAGELYAVGTYAYPVLKPYVDRAMTSGRVKLLTGHEGPGVTGSDNWTTSSDHGPFNAQKIPFLYFGVEDHPGYHKPSDEFAQITPAFFANAAETVLDVILDLDRNLEPVVAVRQAGR
jgi:Zn-dependent M28 family amino/carboxypeptidase